MRILAFITAAALTLSPLVALADGAAKIKKPIKPPAKPAACTGDYGTNVEFEDSTTEAATKAAKEQKLVMVLHISGHFEDPKLT